MKFARVSRGGVNTFALVEGSQLVEISESPFGEWERTGSSFQMNERELIAPVSPAKILAMAENFRSHLHAGVKEHTHPQPFWKAPNAVVGPGESIVLPRGAGRVDAEGELVAVMGRRCAAVTPEHALDYALGYTCGNDVSVREWQSGDKQWWRAKSSDTFAPIGPMILTEVDPAEIRLTTRINGEEVQSCSISEMIFDFPAIISFISQSVTLEPGDLVFSGTSGTPAPLHVGDVVEVEATGVGILKNPVVES